MSANRVCKHEIFVSIIHSYSTDSELGKVWLYIVMSINLSDCNKSD